MVELEVFDSRAFPFFDLSPAGRKVDDLEPRGVFAEEESRAGKVTERVLILTISTWENLEGESAV